MDEEIEITGLVETQKMLLDLPGTVVAEGFALALGDAAAVFEAGLVRRAPVREEQPAKREFPPLNESVVTDIQVSRATGSGSAYTGFGPAGPVALWDEYGHRIVTHSGKDTGKETEPRPFMRQTVEADAEESIDAFSARLLKMVGGRYGGT